MVTSAPTGQRSFAAQRHQPRIQNGTFRRIGLQGKNIGVGKVETCSLGLSARLRHIRSLGIQCHKGRVIPGSMRAQKPGVQIIAPGRDQPRASASFAAIQ